MMIAMTFLAGCFVGAMLFVVWTFKRAKPEFEKHAALAILCARIRSGEYPTDPGYSLMDAHAEGDEFCAAGVARMNVDREVQP